MTTLRVVDEETSEQLGTIARTDGGAISADGLGQAIFDQVKGGKGWDDQKTFAELVAGGWSNGYVSIRA